MMKMVLCLKKSLISSCIIGCSVMASAQDFVWVKNWGNSEGTVIAGSSIARDNEGNIYTTTRFGGTVDFDPGSGAANLTATASSNHALSKFDKNGNFLWAKLLEGWGGAFISTSTDGTNAYVAKQFSGANGVTSIISKLAPDGTLLWKDTLVNGSTSGSSNDVRSIINDKEGNSYITGRFNGAVDFDPGSGTNVINSIGEGIFVLKLDSTGAFKWVKSIGNTIPGFEGMGHDIDIDPAGYVYVSGYFGVPGSAGGDSADFNPGAGTNYLTTIGGTDFFVLKLDTAGNHIWAKSFGGKADELYFPTLALDNDCNVFISGGFSDTVDFDPGVGEFKLHSQLFMGILPTSDIFLSKLDSSGKFIWAGNVVTNEGILNLHRDIKTDMAGNVYATGGFMGVTDFDPDTSSFTLASHGPSINFFISKYDNDGNLLWANKLDYVTANSSDIGGGLAIGTEGDIYVCGMFNGTSDFDFSTNAYNLTDHGATDAFLLKLIECVEYDEETNFINLTGPYAVCPGSTYTYSVEAPQVISVDWQLPSGYSGSSSGKNIDITIGHEEGMITVIVNGICDTSAPVSFPVSFVMQPVNISIDEFVLSTGSNNYDTWQWLLNGNLISGATDSTYTVTENGEYCVIVTKDSCSDTACYTVTNVPGDNSISKLNNPGQYINIYPNPANEIVHISSPEAVDIAVTAIDGRMLYHKRNATAVALKEWATGIYFLRIMDKEGRLIKVEKIVKE